MRALTTIHVILAGTILNLNLSRAAQVTLAWSASTDPTVVGYNLYSGGASRSYTNIVPAGQSTSVSVSNLVSGATYYFAATTIDAAGMESDFSSEVAYQANAAQGVITLTNLAQVYDGTPKPVSAITTPPGLPVALTYNGMAGAPTAAGSYLVIGTITGTNYTGSATNTLNIAQAAGAVQLAGLNQTYNGTARSVSATTTPAGLGVALAYNGAASPPTNAGNYLVVATITDPNYFGGASNSLLVAQAAGAVQLGGLNQTYNGTARAVSATTTPAGLGVGLTYNGAASPPTNAGNYLVVATITDPNYFGGASNSLLVAKAGAAVQLAGLNQTYSGTARPVSATTTPAGLGVGLTYNGAASPPINAGNYLVVATITDPNYFGGASNSLLVAQAAGAVQFAGLNQTYNGTARPVSATTTPAGLGVALTYNGASSPPINAGNYQVVGVITDPNYFGSASNSLVIGKAAASVQLAGLTQVYNGTARPVSATTTPVGLPVTLTYNGAFLAPTNPGYYPVVAVISDPNYSGSASNLLLIAQGIALVQMSNLTQVYNGTPRQVTATTIPAGLSVALTYNGQAQAPSRPGSYTVVGTVSSTGWLGGATNKLTIVKNRNRTGTAAVLPLSGSIQAAATLVKNASAGQALVLSWPPTTNTVSIMHSTDLVSWTLLTSAAGSNGSVVVTLQPGAHFFTAASSVPGATNRVPIVFQAR